VTNRLNNVRTSRDWKFYSEILELIINGAYGLASEKISKLREQDLNSQTNSIEQQMWKLLSLRISIKKGVSNGDLQNLKHIKMTSSWLSPEAYFVLGLLDFQNKKFAIGIKNFQKASEGFEKYLLSERKTVADFNVFIGRLYSEQIAGPSEQLSELDMIAQSIASQESKGSIRTLALIERQKSYIFEELQQPQESLKHILRAVRLFAKTGPQSDFQLSIIQACDIFLDLKRMEQARRFLNKVIPPLDIRVEYSYDFIKWRLGGSALNENKYDYIPEAWREKYRKLSATKNIGQVKTKKHFKWNIERGIIDDVENGQISFSIKLSSLEGRLLKILIKSKTSKATLIDSLWPEDAAVISIDNRLHQMLTRLNKKFGFKAIDFDGSFYVLKIKIELV
jgi:hypothetical protein